jgi:hypothetical protein
MRARIRLESLPPMNGNEGDGTVMSPLDYEEVRYAAAVIVAAFLDPRKLNY